MGRGRCPITGADDTEVIATYTTCITSDGRLLEAEVENRISRTSGLVFNASGARGREGAFYSEEYNLHSESAQSQFMYFDQGVAVGAYDNILDFVASGWQLPARGRALDIGSGKGLLLQRFAARHPGWELAAVEPSRNARGYFAQVMPELEVFEGPFEGSPFIHQQFDVVFANGVLEHLPEPVEFLGRVRHCLARQGVGFIGVPNFANNPTDLFTYDHLSRFTAPTLAALFGLAGLSVVHEWVLASRVPMWFLVRRGPPRPLQPGALYEGSAEAARRSLSFIDRMFAAYNRCVQESEPRGEKIAMYGTGAIGLLGTVHARLRPAMLAAILDDNASLWGSERLGVPIRNPEAIRHLGVNRFVISANPCYLEPIAAKIHRFGGTDVTVFLP